MASTRPSRSRRDIRLEGCDGGEISLGIHLCFYDPMKFRLTTSIDEDLASRSAVIKGLIEDVGPDLVEETIPVPGVPSQTLDLVFKWAAVRQGTLLANKQWLQQDLSTKIEVIWVSPNAFSASVLVPQAD
jgi:hypothetical protein